MNHIPADSKPMPAVMHIAMGTNDDKQNAGWFNGYNWNTYEKHDFMPEPAAKEAKEHLLEFAEECVNDSAMAIEFLQQETRRTVGSPDVSVLCHEHISDSIVWRCVCVSACRKKKRTAD